MKVRPETMKDHQARIKEFFVRGRAVKLRDDTGTFLEWGQGGITAIVLTSTGARKSVMRSSLIADNLPRKEKADNDSVP